MPTVYMGEWLPGLQRTIKVSLRKGSGNLPDLVVFRICGEVAGEAEACDFGRSCDTRNQRHQSRIDGIEIEEDGNASGNRGVAVTEPVFRQSEYPRLVNLDGFAEGFAGHMPDDGTEV